MSFVAAAVVQMAVTAAEGGAGTAGAGATLKQESRSKDLWKGCSAAEAATAAVAAQQLMPQAEKQRKCEHQRR